MYLWILESCILMAYFIIAFVLVAWCMSWSIWWFGSMRKRETRRCEIDLPYRTPTASARAEQTPAVCLKPATRNAHTVLIVLGGKHAFSVLLEIKSFIYNLKLWWNGSSGRSFLPYCVVQQSGTYRGGEGGGTTVGLLVSKHWLLIGLSLWSGDRWIWACTSSVNCKWIKKERNIFLRNCSK